MNKAFVLGAGLGTRLKKLTEALPKPLIPVFGRPLIEYAFQHLGCAGINEFVVNTHHLAGAYEEQFPDGRFGAASVVFRHEPVLLETGGGIDNVADLLAPDPFIVYNGDILTDLPLPPLLEAHANKGHMVSLVLRSRGASAHVALDAQGDTITDIRNLCGSGDEGSYQFTGVYACQPEFLARLEHGTKHSVIPVFLQLIAEGALGGVVIDEGDWWDLGTRDSYLDAVAEIAGSDFPRYLGSGARSWKIGINPGASIAADAEIDSATCIGAGASVGAGARLRNCILWPGARVEAGAVLDRCIVRSGESASGSLSSMDI